MNIENFPLEKLECPNKLDLLAQEIPNKCMDITELDRPLGITQASRNEMPHVSGETRESELIRYTNFLPANNGDWEKSKGDSAWIPNDDFAPQKHNPDGNTWEEIKEKYGFESIPFDKGEPDFTKVGETTVVIEDFSTDRNSNFTQADEKCAEQWTNESKDGKSWSPDDVKAYRKEHELSWHERSDQKTMDLIPSIIHGNVAHTGGISAAKMEQNNE